MRFIIWHRNSYCKSNQKCQLPIKTLRCNFSNFLVTGARSIQFIASSSAADGSKKSTSTAQNATACAPTKSYFVKKSLTSTLGEKSFQFDFPVSEIEKLKIDPVQPPPSEPEIDATATNSVTLHGPSITSKVIASDNSFKFNFSIN